MKIDPDKYPLPKRFRHHTAANMYLPVSELEVISDNYPPLIKNINWSNHFSNGLPPNYLDIGCGKGKFLLDMAEMNSTKNILGIEVRRAPVEWLNTVITGEKLQNCSVIWYSAANGFNFIDDNSIEKIFYLFPDPWPKRKHRKRRLFTVEFLTEIDRIMKQDALLYIATDIEEVHKYHISTLKKANKFSINEKINDIDRNLPQTNKETFCRLNNIPFFSLTCKKIID